MDFTNKGLELSRKEASDLAEVFSITASLSDWGPLSGVRREPTQDERTEARGLVWQTMPNWNTESRNPNMVDEDTLLLDKETFPVIRRVAELALENSQKVVSGLCTPNVCDGYRSEWRPAAYRILAMTAQISETIKQKEQQ
jgi:hypothetical protein